MPLPLSPIGQQGPPHSRTSWVPVVLGVLTALVTAAALALILLRKRRKEPRRQRTLWVQGPQEHNLLGVITFFLHAAEASPEHGQGSVPAGRGGGWEGTRLGIRQPYLCPPPVCSGMCFLLYKRSGHSSHGHPTDAILIGKNPIKREACRGRWGKVDSLGWWEAQPTKVPRPTKESRWEALKALRVLRTDSGTPGE